MSIKRDDRTIAKVRALYEQGDSMTIISRKLRISQSTVSRIVNAFNMQRSGKVNRSSAATTSTRYRALRKAVLENNKNPERRGVPWSPSEEAWLIENENVVTVQEASLHLKRSTDAIRIKMRSLGIKLCHTVSWMPADDEYIKSHFHTKSIKEIASRLGRGYHSVRKRAIQLGLGMVSDQVMHRVTVADIALRLGMAESTVLRWIECERFPTEKVGRWHTVTDEAVTEWLEAGNILRTDRSALDYRDRMMYDRVRSEFYRIIDVKRMDIPALYHIHCYARDDEGRRLIPKALHVSQGKSAEHGYYRKTDVWAWCYYVGHALPEHIADPDIADVQTAWLTVYVPQWELRRHFTSQQQNKWSTFDNFPKSVIKARSYNRAEVIAWLRAHDKHDIAHRLTRGAVLCYDDLIRDRRSRSGVVQ